MTWVCVAPAGEDFFEVDAVRGPTVVEFAVATPRPMGHSSVLPLMDRLQAGFRASETSAISRPRFRRCPGTTQSSTTPRRVGQETRVSLVDVHERAFRATNPIAKPEPFVETTSIDIGFVDADLHGVGASFPRLTDGRLHQGPPRPRRLR